MIRSATMQLILKIDSFIMYIFTNNYRPYILCSYFKSISSHRLSIVVSDRLLFRIEGILEWLVFQTR